MSFYLKSFYLDRLYSNENLPVKKSLLIFFAWLKIILFRKIFSQKSAFAVFVRALREKTKIQQ
jgi:hypothetical protein